MQGSDVRIENDRAEVVDELREGGAFLTETAEINSELAKLYNRMIGMLEHVRGAQPRNAEVDSPTREVRLVLVDQIAELKRNVKQVEQLVTELEAFL